MCRTTILTTDAKRPMQQGSLIHHDRAAEPLHASTHESPSERGSAPPVSVDLTSVDLTSVDLTSGDGIARVDVSDLDVRALDLHPRTAPAARATGTLAEIIDELRRENERLRNERAELLAQNLALRREATLGRLYQDLERRKKEKQASTPDTTSMPAPAAIPAPAAELYHSLPKGFKFADFFRLAAERNVDTATARRCLLYFMEERLLVQTGSRLKKTDRVIRQAS